jgi:hypothetical protein
LIFGQKNNSQYFSINKATLNNQLIWAYQRHLIYIVFHIPLIRLSKSASEYCNEKIVNGKTRINPILLYWLILTFEDLYKF